VKALSFQRLVVCLLLMTGCGPSVRQELEAAQRQLELAKKNEKAVKDNLAKEMNKRTSPSTMGLAKAAQEAGKEVMRLERRVRELRNKIPEEAISTH
jgi:glutamyl-tRNA reductase